MWITTLYFFRDRAPGMTLVKCLRFARPVSFIYKLSAVKRTPVAARRRASRRAPELLVCIM